MDSYVYCAIDIDTNLVKIGFSTNPKNRIRYLNTSTGNTIQLLHVIEGGRELEKSLHRRFKKYQVKGEWFKFTDEIKNHMSNLKPVKLSSILSTSRQSKSICISDENLWERIKQKANRPDIHRDVSQIGTRLFEMWLNGEVAPFPEKEKE